MLFLTPKIRGTKTLVLGTCGAGEGNQATPLLFHSLEPVHRHHQHCHQPAHGSLMLHVPNIDIDVNKS